MDAALRMLIGWVLAEARCRGRLIMAKLIYSVITSLDG
jgi:hypothetical protein